MTPKKCSADRTEIFWRQNTPRGVERCSRTTSERISGLDVRATGGLVIVEVTYQGGALSLVPSIQLEPSDGTAAGC
jgi:hypothetical protein